MKYDSLLALVRACQLGEEPTAAIIVDNDSMYAYAKDGDEEEDLWSGDGPSAEMVLLLQALGCRADRS